VRTFGFHQAALKEADEAANFYEKRQKGLGKRFIEALTDAINKIRSNPKLYGKVDDNIRKSRVLRFPYGIIYRVQNEYIEIIAVIHFKKKPDYWKCRT
jgi:plasmid stabilization system protein ParE